MPAEDSRGNRQNNRSLFSIPAPLRELFDLFPRITYSPNDHPLRPNLALSEETNKLFVWTTENGARHNAASFNPACLKWQVHLRFKNIDFRTIFSNNHASPTGQLPFLVPPRDRNDASKSLSKGDVVTTSELQKTLKADDTSSTSQLQQDSYASLVDGPIRRAWLLHMYLTPNFERFTVPCYIDSQSSSSVVRKVCAWELRKAAETELLKHSPRVDQQTLYDEAREAFQALNQYCQEKASSGGRNESTVLDAALFAYTDLLWSIQYECWADAGLVDILLENEAILDFYDSMGKAYQFWEVPKPERYAALEKTLLDERGDPNSKHPRSKATRRRPAYAQQRK